jgi:hypothetical protein
VLCVFSCPSLESYGEVRRSVLCVFMSISRILRRGKLECIVCFHCIVRSRHFVGVSSNGDFTYVISVFDDIL